MSRLFLCLLLLLPLLLPAQVEQIPEAPREFRGVWIATVGNIDWPSKSGLSSEQQKKELIRYLDATVNANMNAVIFQVRPIGDAFYDSPYEPWSHYLSGESGRPPEPFYDPLEFIIKESHARGLELHAWINPFRVGVGNVVFSEKHISRTNPGIVRTYGKYKWLDPTDEASQQHALKVVEDIVKRYDVDAIHFDDYFYPYAEKGVEFDDSANWTKYKQGGGTMTKSDWRRKRVNEFVASVSKTIKTTKPTVRFGISPFGIWKPGNPEGIVGLNAYDELYADARKWLMDGTVDYLSPQLYWDINKKGQEYPKLMNWWIEQNIKQRHVWPGLFATKYANGKKDELIPVEIINQVKLTQKSRFATGNIMFSAKFLRDGTDNLAKDLVKQVYPFPALVPATTWLDSVPPKAPSISLTAPDANGDVMLNWQKGDDETPARYVLYSKRSGKWYINIYGDNKTFLKLPKSMLPTLEVMALSAVDSVGNESPKQLITLPNVPKPTTP